MDMNAKGEVVLREAGINAEHNQRSNCLTHHVVERQRREYLELAQKAVTEKENFEIQKTQALHDINRAAVTALHSLWRCH